MAKSELVTKKRKRLLLPVNDGPSLAGIFTRSKSSIYLHRNRSGQSRTDSNWGKMHQDVQPLSRKLKGSYPDEDSSMGSDLSSGSIKDLRLRRVFSPFSEDGMIRNCLDDIEKLEKSEPIRDCLGESEEDCENGDLSNEGILQSTPPDSEIFGSKQVVEGNESGLSDQVLEKKTNEGLQRHDGCTEKGFAKRNGTNSPTKPILKPHSRVKVFRTPGSFSYRRLLPYLMDMEKEYSCTPIVSNCQKTEMGLEQEQTLDSKSQVNIVDGSKTNGSMEGNNIDSSNRGNMVSNCQKTERELEEEQSLGSKSQEKMADNSITNGSLEGNNNGSCNRLKMVSVDSLTSRDLGSSMPFVNGKRQKPQLQVSCEVQNLNSPNLNSSPTIVDSCSGKEKLTDVICSDQMTKYDNEVAESSGPSPCSAQSSELLDQKLLTATNKSESRDYDNIRQNSDDEEQQSETKGMPIANAFHSFEAQKLHSPNSVLSEMRGHTKCCLQQRVDNDGEVLEQVENVNVEYRSITLLGSDLCSRAETGDSIENRVECVSQGVDHGTEKPKNETLGRNHGQGGDNSLGSSLENKSVPNPRLQKLSRILNSYHCRRLLPFLKEITKDYACASGNDPSPKVEKSSEEKPLSPFLTSGKVMCMDNLSSKTCAVGNYNVDESLLSIAATTATTCSHKQVADSPVLMDSQQDQESPVVHSALDTIQKLENSPGNYVESSAMSSSSLTNPGLLPGEQGAKLVSHPPEEICIKSTLKCADSEKQIEAYNPPGIPVAVVKKGILKRNPRGCRGVCTCLNCSSFRLHAERSFEFSRNQMQDAEEVALDLIKELSWLRNMLEKSAFDAKDESSSYINQVKEACKKASVAEELAKSRLREMNYELNIHCKTPCGQRPSVRFASDVEEQLNQSFQLPTHQANSFNQKKNMAMAAEELS